MKSCGSSNIFQRIRWLMGKWKSVNGCIQHPTLNSVDYKSHLNILECGITPTLKFTSIGRHSTSNNIMHYFTGFMTFKDNMVYLYYVENCGFLSFEIAKLEEKSLHFTSKHIHELPLREKSLNITKIERHYQMKGKRLNYKFFIQRIGTELEEVVNLTYEKNVCDD